MLFFQLGGGRVSQHQIQIGGVLLDDQEKSVWLDGEPVSLTPTEYEILRLLMRHNGQVFSPAAITESCLGTRV